MAARNAARGLRPRWLRCHTAHGAVRALAFTLAPTSPSYTGPLDEARLLRVLQTCRGRYGSTLDYVMRTAHALRQTGIRDNSVERLVALAQRHGLV